MSARHLRLTFPETQTLQPVIYHLVKDFDVVPCIRRASIENHFGWMIAELSGSSEALDAALAYLDSIGVGYTNAEGDILEG